MNKLCKYFFTSHPSNLYIDFIMSWSIFTSPNILPVIHMILAYISVLARVQGCSSAVPDLYEDNTQTHTHYQSSSVSVSCATVQETELSMLAVDAACGWKGREEGGEIGGERERQGVTRH